VRISSIRLPDLTQMLGRGVSAMAARGMNGGEEIAASTSANIGSTPGNSQTAGPAMRDTVAQQLQRVGEKNAS